MTARGCIACALLLAACSAKTEKVPPKAEPPAGVSLAPLDLSPGGAPFTGMKIDAPAGAKLEVHKGALLLVSPEATVEIDAESPTIDAVLLQYQTVASQIEAKIEVTEQTDNLLVYAIVLGPRRELGVDTRVTVGKNTVRCFLRQSTSDAKVRDLARYMCGTLR